MSKTDIYKTYLRIPVELADAIKALSIIHNRSVNAEIKTALETWVSTNQPRASAAKSAKSAKAKQTSAQPNIKRTLRAIIENPSSPDEDVMSALGRLGYTSDEIQYGLANSGLVSSPMPMRMKSALQALGPTPKRRRKRAKDGR